MPEPSVAPLPPLELDVAIGPMAYAELEQLFADYERQRARRPHLASHLEPLPPGLAAQVAELLRTLVRVPHAQEDESLPVLRSVATLWTDSPVQKALRRLVTAPDFALIHGVRLLMLMGQFPPLRDERHRMGMLVDPILQSWRAVREGIVGLHEVAHVMRCLGLDDGLLGVEMLDRWTRILPPLFAWEPEAVWPYFEGRTELLMQALSCDLSAGSVHSYVDIRPFLRANALSILASSPKVPEEMEDVVWKVALGSSRSERLQVAKCLERLPGRDERLAAALADRHQEIRMAAADWVRQFRIVSLVPNLRQALAREKSDGPRALLMRTLEYLGIPAEEFLDRPRMLDEARKGLERGVPAALSWAGLDSLPELTWKEGGEPIDPTLVRWWIVMAWKLKSPEPSPYLRACFGLVERSGREALGRRLLESWMAQDTIPRHGYDEAVAETTRIASQFSSPAYQAVFPGRTPEQLFQMHLNGLLAECQGSAIAEKGILGVAAACCGPDAVLVVQKYLERWYGNRAAQCRALVAMLSWIDHPLAVQALYGVASRFRTRTIQAEADRCLHALADRTGWTVEELAERTVPTAGFSRDARGGRPSLVLSYGERQFVATLDDEFRIHLAGPEGQEMKSLPEPRKIDDPARAREAKETLSRARKELKGLIAAQKERLLDALCTQRTWRGEDWSTFVLGHPLVGCLARSLVWVAERAGAEPVTFRPLDDGSLTAVDDEEVCLEPSDLVRLAHGCTVPPEEAAAWSEHFRDYEVTSLLPQFERPPFHLHPDRRGDLQADEFEGCLVNSFRLRSRATRLGYTRGLAQDGGSYHDYRRTFPGLGMEAVIQFSGSPLPEVERTVALEALYFTRLIPETRGSAGDAVRVPLGAVPAVLLSECWNDLRTLAEEGSGYDPDWEAKVR